MMGIGIRAAAAGLTEICSGLDGVERVLTQHAIKERLRNAII